MDRDNDKLADFLEFGISHYQNDLNFVPPLLLSQFSYFQDNHPFFEHGKIKLFLLYKKDHIVGRASASINELYDNAVGNIGFYECIDDNNASKLLIENAEQWLRKHGCNKIIAPVQFSIFHSYRFMVKGFELPRFFGEPYNKPFYHQQFAQAGYKDIHRWFSYDLNKNSLSQSLLIAKEYKKKWKSLDYTIKTLAEMNFENGLMLLWKITLDSFQKNFGWFSVSWDEWKFVYGGMNRFIIPDFVLFAFDDNQSPAGFVYALPNWASQIKKIEGDIFRLDELSKDNIQQMIYMAVGIAPEHRHPKIVDQLWELLLQKTDDHNFQEAFGALFSFSRNVCTRVTSASREYIVLEKSLS